MNVEQKKRFLDLPNFDAKIFEEITGINLAECGYIEPKINQVTFYKLTNIDNTTEYYASLKNKNSIMYIFNEFSNRWSKDNYGLCYIYIGHIKRMEEIHWSFVPFAERMEEHL